jgi:hypothetical protein
LKKKTVKNLRNRKKAPKKLASLVRQFGKKEGEKKFKLAAFSREFLQKSLEVQKFEQVLCEIRARKISAAFVRQSREQYLVAISLALGLYYAAAVTDNPEQVLQDLIKDTGQRVTARTTTAQIVVRTVIDYGDTKEELKDNRQYVSRDALAIDHLVRHAVFPEDVVELAKKKGEGLDAWARKETLAKKAETHYGPKSKLQKNPVNALEPYDDWDDETDDHEGDENNNHSDQADAQNRAGKGDRTIPKASPPLDIVKRIANLGHIFCPDDHDEAILWAVTAVKLRRATWRNDSDKLVSLADALTDYAETLNPGS